MIIRTPSKPRRRPADPPLTPEDRALLDQLRRTPPGYLLL